MLTSAIAFSFIDGQMSAYGVAQPTNEHGACVCVRACTQDSRSIGRSTLHHAWYIVCGASVAHA
eukprot:5462489-Alexandrium_andersonii.AAC.1